VCPSRGVHQRHEKEKRQGEQTRRETCLNLCDQAERRCDKASTHEVRPKLMPRNPRRYDRRDGLRQREMLGAECREWRCVKEWSKQNQPVPASRLLPIAAKNNCDQPDDKSRPTGKIRPNHFAGDRVKKHDFVSIRAAYLLRG